VNVRCHNRFSSSACYLKLSENVGLITMDTSKIEALLEQLIDKQDDLISRIEILESTLEGQLVETNSALDEVKYSLSKIYDEINWWGEEESLAKQILNILNRISH
jgi:hypothetical protein